MSAVVPGTTQAGAGGGSNPSKKKLVLKALVDEASESSEDESVKEINQRNIMYETASLKLKYVVDPKTQMAMIRTAPKAKDKDLANKPTFMTFVEDLRVFLSPSNLNNVADGIEQLPIRRKFVDENDGKLFKETMISLETRKTIFFLIEVIFSTIS